MAKLVNIKHETIAQCVADGMGFDEAVAKALPSASSSRRKIWVSLLKQGEYADIQARIGELQPAAPAPAPEVKAEPAKPAVKKTTAKAKAK